MRSLQAYCDRIGGLSLSSRYEDRLLSPRLGLAIAVTNSNVFNRALSFQDFESNVSLWLSFMGLQPEPMELKPSL